MELNAYDHAQCVQMYGWKCLICSLEAKDQLGLELQHIGDGIVYINGIDGSKWVWEVLMLVDSEAAARVSGAAETVDYFG